VEEIWELENLCGGSSPITSFEEQAADESFFGLCSREEGLCCCRDEDKSKAKSDFNKSCFELCSSKDKDKEKEKVGFFIALYVYVVDIWNFLDMLMIISGILGLGLRDNAATMLDTFALRELWHVQYFIQCSDVCLSLCVIIAYFRFLHFLAHWEYIGVMVLTVFYMMGAICSIHDFIHVYFHWIFSSISLALYK